MNIGKLPENQLKRSVLRQLKTKRDEIMQGAGVGTDCAFFNLPEDKGMLVCMQEAVVATQEYPAADAIPVPQLLQGAANNLAAGGGALVGVVIGLMLPAGAPETVVKELMSRAESTCKELNCQIAGGQTSFSFRVSAPVMTVTGFGTPFEEGRPEGKVHAGQSVVMSKWAGLEGTALLAEFNREALLERYPAYLVDEATAFYRFRSVIPEAATAVKSGVCMMHDVSEGGIFGALWELAERAGVGLNIDLKKIPLRQETVEVCELCNVNPYELLSGGSLLMITDNGPGLTERLREAGIPAAIVGEVTEGNARIITNEDEVRYMDRPKHDGWYAFLETHMPQEG